MPRDRRRGTLVLAAAIGVLIAGIFGMVQGLALTRPIPSPSPSARPLPQPQPTGLPLPTPTPTATAAAPAPYLQPAAPLPRSSKSVVQAAGSYEFVAVSPAVTVTNFRFAGSSTVTSGAATVSVLTFTADSLTFQAVGPTRGLELDEPCIAAVGPASLGLGDAAATTAAFSGPISLSVAYISFSEWDAGTSAYVALSYDAGSPPSPAPPALTTDAAHPLQDLQMVATTMQAAEASYTGWATFVRSC